MKQSDKKRMLALTQFAAGTLTPNPKRKPYTRKSPKNDMREKKLERRGLFYLNSFPHIIAWKTGEMANYNSWWVLDGMPDTQGFNFNTLRLFFVEWKDESGVWLPSQVAFYGLCQQMNIPYVLAYGIEDLNDVIC